MLATEWNGEELSRGWIGRNVRHHERTVPRIELLLKGVPGLHRPSGVEYVRCMRQAAWVAAGRTNTCHVHTTNLARQPARLSQRRVRLEGLG